MKKLVKQSIDFNPTIHRVGILIHASIDPSTPSLPSFLPPFLPSRAIVGEHPSIYLHLLCFMKQLNGLFSTNGLNNIDDQDVLGLKAIIYDNTVSAKLLELN